MNTFITALAVTITGALIWAASITFHEGQRNLRDYQQMQTAYDNGQRYWEYEDGTYGLNMEMPFCEDMPPEYDGQCDPRPARMDARREGGRCGTDTECMEMFGGGGGPEPQVPR